MNELPKELTPELLELVYPDYRDRLCEWMDVEDNVLSTYYNCGSFNEQGRPTGLGMEINIDTLTRLMKEFILEHKQILGSYYSTSVRGWCTWIDDLGNKGIAETEFKSVLKATSFVAKELGLLKEINE